MRSERTRSGIIVPDGTLDPDPPARRNVEALARWLAKMMIRQGLTGAQIQRAGRLLMKEGRRLAK